VLGIFGFSTILLLSALVAEKAFFLILGLSSLAVCAMYLLQTIAVMIATRRGTIPAPEPKTFDLGKTRVPVAVIAAICFTLVCAALIFLPQFAGNGYVFAGLLALTALWAVTGLRKRLATGEAGPNFAKTHIS
jgi:amino acid transporter